MLVSHINKHVTLVDLMANKQVYLLAIDKWEAMSNFKCWHLQVENVIIKQIQQSFINLMSWPVGSNLNSTSYFIVFF